MIRRFLPILGTVLFIALLLVGCGGSSGEKSETKLEAAPPAGKLVRIIGRHFLVSDLQGRELRKVALPRGEAPMWPFFSVEGDELWFLTGRGTKGNQRYRLHIYPTSGSGRGSSSPVAALTGTAVGALRVSPDGDRVAMAVGISPSTGCTVRGMVLGRNGEQIAELSEPGVVSVEVLSWSRDGSQLLYSLARDPERECGRYGRKPTALLIHRPGTGRDRVLTAPHNVHVTSSAWSPDDSRIALTECKNEEDWSCRLVIIDANGPGRRVLGNLGRVYSHTVLVWAVTTNEIVTPRMTSPSDEATEVWAFNADSGAERKIADWGYLGGMDASSRDGSRIVDVDGILDVETGQRWRFPANLERRTRLGTGLEATHAYFLEDPKKE